ncbi:alpha/beta hydrolase [Phyllobacterium sp. SB3]|uniref:alpha/beta fold hydrolase n=1 Tax=Phyllobacterium sp. SB3 TaxID=3156073 RepID=UPI0032AECBFC
MSTTKDGIVNYERRGSGAPLVLIHGVGANLSSWDGVCAALEDQFDVLRLDLRGHGASARVDGSLTVDDFAGDVLKIMDEEGIVQAHVVGFSLGGLIVQRLASRWPERFDRIVILSAVAGRTSEERARVLARLGAIRKDGIDAIVGPAMDRWFTKEFAEQHPELIENRIAELKAVHIPSYLEAYRVFGETELIDDLHLIPNDTLVMTGEFDPNSNVRMAKAIRERIPNSELRILSDLKHSVLVEAPELIAGHVKEFLSRQSGKDVAAHG